jgi:hypothetical protein
MTPMSEGVQPEDRVGFWAADREESDMSCIPMISEPLGLRGLSAYQLQASVALLAAGWTDQPARRSVPAMGNVPR